MTKIQNSKQYECQSEATSTNIQYWHSRKKSEFRFLFIVTHWYYKPWNFIFVLFAPFCGHINFQFRLVWVRHDKISNIIEWGCKWEWFLSDLFFADQIDTVANTQHDLFNPILPVDFFIEGGDGPGIFVGNFFLENFIAPKHIIYKNNPTRM